MTATASITISIPERAPSLSLELVSIDGKSCFELWTLEGGQTTTMVVEANSRLEISLLPEA